MVGADLIETGIVEPVIIAGPTGEKVAEANRTDQSIITAGFDLDENRAMRAAWGFFLTGMVSSMRIAGTDMFGVGRSSSLSPALSRRWLESRLSAYW